MIRTARLGACPAGFVQNGDSCVDPTQWQGICPPNTQVMAPGGAGPATAAQQAAGQFTCVALASAAVAAAAAPPVFTQPAPGAYGTIPWPSLDTVPTTGSSVTSALSQIPTWGWLAAAGIAALFFFKK